MNNASLRMRQVFAAVIATLALVASLIVAPIVGSARAEAAGLPAGVQRIAENVPVQSNMNQAVHNVAVQIPAKTTIPTGSKLVVLFRADKSYGNLVSEGGRIPYPKAGSISIDENPKIPPADVSVKETVNSSTEFVRAFSRNGRFDLIANRYITFSNLIPSKNLPNIGRIEAYIAPKSVTAQQIYDAVSTPAPKRVTPAAPGFSGQPDGNGNYTVTIPNSEGVNYTVKVNGITVPTRGSISVKPGDTVTVDAAPQNGYELQGTKHWDHAFPRPAAPQNPDTGNNAPAPAPAPTPAPAPSTPTGPVQVGNAKVVVPGTPTIKAGLKCGDVTEVEYPDVIGVTYERKVEGANLVVTAVAQKGYKLASGSTTKWTFPALINCPVRGIQGGTTTPQAPTATNQNQCGVEGELNLPKINGVIYVGEYTTTDKVVTVRALPVPGFNFPAGVQTEWKFDLSVKECDVPPAGQLDSADGVIYSLSDNGEVRKVFKPSTNALTCDDAPTFVFPRGYRYEALGIGPAGATTFTAYAVQTAPNGSQKILSYSANSATPASNAKILNTAIVKDPGAVVIGGAVDPIENVYYYVTVNQSGQPDLVRAELYKVTNDGRSLSGMKVNSFDAKIETLPLKQNGEIDLNLLNGDLAFNKAGEPRLLLSDQTVAYESERLLGFAGVFAMNRKALTGEEQGVWQRTSEPTGLPKDGFAFAGALDFFSTNEPTGYMWARRGGGDRGKIGSCEVHKYGISDLAQFVVADEVAPDGPYGGVDVKQCTVPQVIWADTALGTNMQTLRMVEIGENGAPTGRRITDTSNTPNVGGDIAVSPDNKYMYAIGVWQDPVTRKNAAKWREGWHVLIREYDVDASVAKDSFVLTERSKRFSAAQKRMLGIDLPEGAVDLGVNAYDLFSGDPQKRSVHPVNSLAYAFDGNGEPILIFGGQEGAHRGDRNGDRAPIREGYPLRTPPRVYEYKLSSLLKGRTDNASLTQTSALVATAPAWGNKYTLFTGWAGDFVVLPNGDLLGGATNGQAIVFEGVPSTTNPNPRGHVVGYTNYTDYVDRNYEPNGQIYSSYGLAIMNGKLYSSGGLDAKTSSGGRELGVFEHQKMPSRNDPSTTTYNASKPFFTSFKAAVTAGKPETLGNMVSYNSDTPIIGMTSPASANPACNVGVEKTFVDAQPVAGKDGEYTATYNVKVSNPNASETTYTLKDKPQFDESLTTSGITEPVKVTGPNGQTFNATFNRNGELNLTPNGEVKIAGKSDQTYKVEIPLKLATVNGRQRTLNDYVKCTGTAQGANDGLFNTVTMTSPNGSASAWACGDLPKFSVEKTRVTGESGPIQVKSDGSFTARYQIVVRNSGTVAAAIPEVLDAFQDQEQALRNVNTVVNQVTVDGKQVLGKGNPAAYREINGVKHYNVYLPPAQNPNPAAQDVILQPGEARAFIVEVSGTMLEPKKITSEHLRDLIKCTESDGSTTRQGLWNHVVMGGDSDGDDNNWACVPIEPEPRATLQVVKVDGDNGNAPLRGSEFTLFDKDPRGGNPAPYAQLKELDPQNEPGVLTVVCPDGADGKPTDCLVANPDGSAKKYWLVETKAPGGKSLLVAPIEFTLKKVGSEFAFDFSMNPKNTFIDPRHTDGIVATATVKISNVHTGDLPMSGGPGVVPYVVFGAGIAIAGLVLGMRRRNGRA